MTTISSPNWNRSYYKTGGGDAYLLYAVFGDFAQPLSLPVTNYRSRGLPTGVNLAGFTRAEDEEFIRSCYQGWLCESLQLEQLVLFTAVEQAPMCLLLQGTVTDPPTLDYLRNVVGVVTALLTTGGVAVLDTQALTWFAPERWRERIFVPDAPVPTHHVTILLSPQEDGKRLWIHTRGMRKFGRPDLSVHDVLPEYQDACIELFNRFITMQAFGEIIPEGQAIRMQRLPSGMVCHHRGDYDDPHFNNAHIEIQMPMQP